MFFGVLATSVGGICCSLNFLIGEALLEATNHHQTHERNNHYIALNDASRMGAIGGLITNLTLYVAIVIYACKIDPKRENQISYSNHSGVHDSGISLICGELHRPTNRGENISLLLFNLAMHASNMLVSGTVGYWVYTRNNKSVININESMESLAVGTALTMIPFCLLNFLLASAYGVYSKPNLQNNNFFIPLRHTPPPKTERDLLEEIARNTRTAAENTIVI